MNPRFYVNYSTNFVENPFVTGLIFTPFKKNFWSIRLISLNWRTSVRRWREWQHLPSKRNHPFSKYLKFSEKLTFLTPWYAYVRVRIKGVRNVSFSEYFAYLVDGCLMLLDRVISVIALECEKRKMKKNHMLKYKMSLSWKFFRCID